MEKIWLKSYPPGVPAEIRYDEYQSIGELVEASVKKYAERPAYHNMGKSISFADLDRLTQNFGAWLQAKGLGRGARVAIMMPNVLQYPVALFGALRAGLHGRQRQSALHRARAGASARTTPAPK